jgi:hypothetical protein
MLTNSLAFLQPIYRTIRYSLRTEQHRLCPPVIDGPAWIPFCIINLKATWLTKKLIPAKDMVLEDLLGHLNEACDFIKEGINSDKGGVLVRCHQGKSRSGSVVVGYSEFPFVSNGSYIGDYGVAAGQTADQVSVMRECDLSYDEAHQRAREGRPSIMPNSGFLEQLKI